MTPNPSITRYAMTAIDLAWFNDQTGVPFLDTEKPSELTVIKTRILRALIPSLSYSDLVRDNYGQWIAVIETERSPLGRLFCDSRIEQKNFIASVAVSMAEAEDDMKGKKVGNQEVLRLLKTRLLICLPLARPSGVA